MGEEVVVASGILLEEGCTDNGWESGMRSAKSAALMLGHMNRLDFIAQLSVD